ncbi:FAD-dependent oxidoreductase [Leucobacter sp. gxy201]|uniref:NAD(P)/FAD-dependent oxidoreductase n=1 Tax=Leucobacter sp. gxy201 TaxID=2957200 RepID=UPI003DA069B6
MVVQSEVTPEFVNGSVSYWMRDAGRPHPRPGLPGPIEADVAIVGGGFTGLWTAYYLKCARPELDIAVIEREFAGFGSSGRNGGWFSAKAPGQFARYARESGRDAAVAFEREMMASVGEGVAVAEREGFGEHVRHDGMIQVATSPAQLSRLRAYAAALGREGWAPGRDFHLLTPPELDERVRVADVRGAFWSPHCARIHPAKYVLALAETVERLGVRIYEGTTATAIEPRRVRTNRGDVRAQTVVQAIEGYTGSLEGQRRRYLPMNSSMVVTEPLGEAQLAAIGWRGAETMGDFAHSFAYLQRTADHRIAIGGRGIPYHFASTFDRQGRTADFTVGQLGTRLVELFPSLAGVRLDHSWSGVLGVPRDWCAGVDFDASTGIAHAGGYVGHGVTATNLAGRTLRDLILGEDTELTRLPWVGHRSRNWEPEPLRWIAARSLYAVYRFADRREYRSGSGRTHPAARLANLISGR